jgi:hypothetical protein
VVFASKLFNHRHSEGIGNVSAFCPVIRDQPQWQTVANKLYAIRRPSSPIFERRWTRNDCEQKWPGTSDLKTHSRKPLVTGRAFSAPPGRFRRFETVAKRLVLLPA